MVSCRFSLCPSFNRGSQLPTKHRQVVSLKPQNMAIPAASFLPFCLCLMLSTLYWQSDSRKAVGLPCSWSVCWLGPPGSSCQDRVGSTSSLLQIMMLSCLVMSDSLRPPGSSIHGIFPTRILEWVTIFPSRRSSWLKDQMASPVLLCLLHGRWILYHWCLSKRKGRRSRQEDPSDHDPVWYLGKGDIDGRRIRYKKPQIVGKSWGSLSVQNGDFNAIQESWNPETYHLSHCLEAAREECGLSSNTTVDPKRHCDWRLLANGTLWNLLANSFLKAGLSITPPCMLHAFATSIFLYSEGRFSLGWCWWEEEEGLCLGLCRLLRFSPEGLMLYFPWEGTWCPLWSLLSTLLLRILLVANDRNLI